MSPCCCLLGLMGSVATGATRRYFWSGDTILLFCIVSPHRLIFFFGNPLRHNIHFAFYGGIGFGMMFACLLCFLAEENRVMIWYFVCLGGVWMKLWCSRNSVRIDQYRWRIICISCNEGNIDDLTHTNEIKIDNSVLKKGSEKLVLICWYIAVYLFDIFDWYFLPRRELRIFQKAYFRSVRRYQTWTRKSSQVPDIGEQVLVWWVSERRERGDHDTLKSTNRSHNTQIPPGAIPFAVMPQTYQEGRTKQMCTPYLRTKTQPST